MKIKYSIRPVETFQVGGTVELAFIPDINDEEYEWIVGDSLKMGEKYKIKTLTNSTEEGEDENNTPRIKLEGKIYWHESRLFKRSQ